MRFNRVILIALTAWTIASITNASRSYAQGELFELPYVGVAKTDFVAFHVTNAHDTKGVAINGTGPVGVRGASLHPVGEYAGIGVYGIGFEPYSTGVMGVGEMFGVGGETKGNAAVYGRYRLAATSEYQGIKPGEMMNPTHGMLATSSTGVKGVVSSAIEEGTGVTGIYASNIVDAPNARDEWGTNRGFLGTSTAGVYGESDLEDGVGVGARNLGEKGAAFYGVSEKGMAALFEGRVVIDGLLLSTKITAGEVYAKEGLIGANAGKFFKIDHPLDPENQYLVHSSVESSEYKNFYDGIATLDANGTASVTLPHWFEALNRDFRYQLTPIGAYAPLYIGHEIEQGRFQIAGGKSGMRVSWMVTGVRRDPYAAAHPVQVEQPKASHERGKYLAPREYGMPETSGIDYRSDRKLSLNSKSKGRTR